MDPTEVADEAYHQDDDLRQDVQEKWHEAEEPLVDPYPIRPLHRHNHENARFDWLEHLHDDRDDETPIEPVQVVDPLPSFVPIPGGRLAHLGS
jgi:hypothetical protein